MKLYLVRHGQAEQTFVDDKRPLSQQGLTEVDTMAHFLLRNNINIQQVFHSGKLRAEQTAEHLAADLKPGANISCLPGLLPDDDVKPIAVYCNHWQDNVMLVGHMPFMAKLVSELLIEKEHLQCVDFQTAAILCLERIAIFHWCISWFINPSLI